MKHTYTYLEDYVLKFYSKIDIFHPYQLEPEIITTRLGMSLVYIPYNSMNAGNTIFLDDRLTVPQQWQDFGHELCHALWHTGNQLNLPLPYKEYQEWKADNFAHHVCIPTFMLDRMNLNRNEHKNVWKIQEMFQVEREFAEKRLQQYVCNTLQNLYR